MKADASHASLVLCGPNSTSFALYCVRLILVTSMHSNTNQPEEVPAESDFLIGDRQYLV